MIPAIHALMGLDKPHCASCGIETTEDFLLCGQGERIARICRDCLDDYALEHGEDIETTAKRCRCNPIDLIRRSVRQ